jgi:uncharacterized protein (DUF1697 family)
MTTFIALLRAVNVGGQNRIPMAELRRQLSAIGLNDVQTYVQSGNIVFPADGDDPEAQAAVVHDVIARDLGHDVNVIGLSAADLALVASGNPLVGEGVDEKALHVTFLSAPVTAAAFRGLVLPAQPDERALLGADGPPSRGAAPGGEAELAGRVIYLQLPHGYGRTKLNNAYFERALETPATTRNWRTVLALTEMCAAVR